MNLVKILKDNKQSIIENTVSWIQLTYRSRTMEFDKCTRDIGYIYDAWLYDLENNSTTQTQSVTNKFWKRGTSQLKTTHVELLAYDYINTLINDIHPSNEIDNLVSITKHNILNPPVFATGAFDYSTANRINTYNWTDQIPDQVLIDDIIQGIHDFVPSKQRIVRYNIRVIPAYKMPNLRQKIYQGTKAEPSSPDSRYNPQVLAPYVIAIAPKVTLAVPHNKDYLMYEAGVEIGLAAMFISLAAPAVGLDVGFCACIQNEEDMIKDIGISPKLYLGIGYKSDDVKYLCPVYNKIVDIPGSDYNQKPSIEEYVKYV
jgi:hypothetical protein